MSQKRALGIFISFPGSIGNRLGLTENPLGERVAGIFGNPEECIGIRHRNFRRTSEEGSLLNMLYTLHRVTARGENGSMKEIEN